MLWKIICPYQIQSYAGHRNQTMVTIFSEEGDTRLVQNLAFSPRIRSKVQVGPWASLKRFSRNLLYCQAIKGQFFQQKQGLKKIFYFLQHRT